MKYRLEKCSWNITGKCNLNCMHCSEKKHAFGEDLSAEEALDLAEQIGALGVEWVTFTGGEPFYREDWDKIALRLWERGVKVEIITNGTLVDEALIEKLKKSHVQHVAISVDGTERIHDRIRDRGVFARCKEALGLLQRAGMSRAVVTTLMKHNLEELETLKEILIAWEVPLWQLQIGVPVGGLGDNRDCLIQPGDVAGVIDFCYETALDGRIRVAPADGIGYYTKKETIVRGMFCDDTAPPVWYGCRAGISSLTIRSDGNILGASLCAEQDSQGNVRDRSLREIWEDENSFALLRQFRPQRMEGYCGKCRYVSWCKGGCVIMKLGFGGSVYAENQYCAYRSYREGKGEL